MDEQYVPVETRIGDEDDCLRNKNLNNSARATWYSEVIVLLILLGGWGGGGGGAGQSHLCNSGHVIFTTADTRTAIQKSIY